MRWFLLLALAVPSCATAVTKPKSDTHVVEQYTFPLSLPNETRVCVERVTGGWAIRCVTLGQLRQMTREQQAE